MWNPSNETYDLSQVPAMSINMAENDAFLNGWKHGKEGVVTPNICFLLIGSKEREAWFRGYEAADWEFRGFLKQIEENQRPLF